MKTKQYYLQYPLMMTIRFYSGLLLLVLSYAAAAQSGSNDNQKQIKDSLTSELEQIYRQGQFNGFSVSIVDYRGTLYQNGIGYSNIATKQGYTENTIQNIGSISKTLIGIALLKAQEMGKLNLDSPVNKYLPFKVENPFYPNLPITIRNLATHTSTITDNEFYLKKSYILKVGQDLRGKKLYLDEEQILNPPDSVIPMKNFLENMVSEKGAWYSEKSFLQHKPGSIYEYSNVGATLAAYIVGLVTGEEFNKFTYHYILKPLKMDHSGWKFDEVDFSKYSCLYQSPDTLLPFYSIITYPDGNFITSASDMSRYLAELIKGYHGHGTILSKSSYAELFKQQLNAGNFEKRNEQNPYNESYNVGVFMGFSVTGNVGHTGGDPGVASMMFFDPKTNFGRILIVNTNINNKAGNDEFYAIWDRLGKYQSKLHH